MRDQPVSPRLQCGRGEAAAEIRFVEPNHQEAGGLNVVA